MPQPTTHYLVAKNSIPKNDWENWWYPYKQYIGLGSSAPDLFYLSIIKGKNLSDISDLIHHEKSYDIFCELINIAKLSRINGAEKTVPEKQLSFAFGFYCHVITDCIFHPYVYRNTQDHWNTKNSSKENLHKAEEFCIDCGIYEQIEGTNISLNNTTIECPGEDDDLLDYPIVTAFYEGLHKTYNITYDININSKFHPINLAYNAFSDIAPLLFKGEKIMSVLNPLNMFSPDIISQYNQYKDITNFYNTPYNVFGLPQYTKHELFNMATTACTEIYNLIIEFWKNNSITDSKEFFKNFNDVNFLNTNYNLDTGLPCKYNTEKLMQIECKEHFSQHIDELTACYKKLYNKRNLL